MVVFFNHYTDIFTSLLRGARSDNMARFVMAANTVRVHGNTYLFGKFGDEKKGNGLLRAAFSSLLFHLHGFCSISGVRHTTLRETNNKQAVNHQSYHCHLLYNVKCKSYQEMRKSLHFYDIKGKTGPMNLPLHTTLHTPHP